MKNSLKKEIRQILDDDSWSYLHDDEKDTVSLLIEAEGFINQLQVLITVYEDEDEFAMYSRVPVSPQADDADTIARIDEFIDAVSRDDEAGFAFEQENNICVCSIRCSHPDDPMEFRTIILGFSLMASIVAQAVAEIIFHALSGDEAMVYFKDQCRQFMSNPDDPQERN